MKRSHYGDDEEGDTLTECGQTHESLGDHVIDTDKAFYLLDRGKKPDRFDSADWVMDSIREKEQQQKTDSEGKLSNIAQVRKEGGSKETGDGSRVTAVKLLDKKYH